MENETKRGDPSKPPRFISLFLKPGKLAAHDHIFYLQEEG